MAAQPAETRGWVRFAQSEDLTVRIRNILHDYAFGPGVFRELLQNADDARARRLVLLADGTQYKGLHTEEPSLLDARLGAWQGPAVCAFNDAEFSDADFEGICRVGASGKRHDQSKIGHYGLGFNASYHLTDVVSFASRDRLCIFDPHERHLPNKMPGLQLTLGSEEQKRYRAQLEPFEAVAAACGAELWPLRGTLFRLPLRSPELAELSEICPEPRPFSEVLGVLQELLRNASELLLFLQSVEKVQVLKRDHGSSWQSMGSVTLHTASAAAAEQLRRERRLLTSVASAARAEMRTRRVAYSFSVEEEGPAVEGVARSAWMVVGRCEPREGAVSEEKEKSEEGKLPGYRVGSVAMRLWPAAETPLDGAAFCFLPLCLATGLSVHVSGNFAVSANRRDLWRRSDDKAASHGNLRAAWNDELLTGTLPRAYADALELRALGLVTPEAAGSQGAFALQNFLPLGPWTTPSLLGACPPAELWALWPRGGTGTFEATAVGAMMELFSRDAEVLWDIGREKYTRPKKALLYSASNHGKLSSTLKAAFSKILTAGTRRGIVPVPDHICSTLVDAKNLTWLSPHPVSTALRGLSVELTKAEADELVGFLLAPGGTGPLTLLQGLKLCPLVGGGLGLFEKQGENELWWAEDQALQELMPQRSFVDPASETFALLKPRLVNAPLNIRMLNAQAVSKVVETLVPPSWKGKKIVEVDPYGRVLVDGELARELARTEAKTPAQPAGGRRSNQAPAPAKTKGKARKNGRGKLRWEAEEEAVDQWWCEQEDDEEAEAPAEAPAEEVPMPACSCTTVEELQALVHRCELVWEIIERGKERGASPFKFLQELPCVPVLAPQGAGRVADRPQVWLLSLSEAVSRAAMAFEDFTKEETELLQALGVHFLRPGPRLREALNLNRSNVLKALKVALAERLAKRAPEEDMERKSRGKWRTWGTEETTPGTQSWSASGARGSTGGSGRLTRLLQGLQEIRLPLAEAVPLRRLVLSLIRRGVIGRDVRALESFPIFETHGGNFAVPLVPTSARVITPSEPWEEHLLPHFADFLVKFDGEAGDFLAEIGKERGSIAPFLGEFCAPRLGLFDQALTIRFLEALSAEGAHPWKPTGAPKDWAAAAGACMEAPVIVFADGSRRKCSDLVDPSDIGLRSLMGNSVEFPPAEYCTPVVLSVLRRAGLKSLMDEGVFYNAAVAAERSGDPTQGAALLKHLGLNASSVKWTSRAFPPLARLRIFPMVMSPWLPIQSHVPPPYPSASTACMSLALEGSTLYHNASISWTQLALMDPRIFEAFPVTFLRRFSGIHDPVGMDTVVANLIEVSRRWALGKKFPAEDLPIRQDIVRQHLIALKPLSKRNHAAQVMVQSSLSRTAFLLLDDCSLVMPSDVFLQLQQAGDSSDEEGEEARSSGKPSASKSKKPCAEEGVEEEEAEEEDEDTPAGPSRSSRASAEAAAASRSKGSNKMGKKPSLWTLPKYLRPYRRLLLFIAGPAIHKQTQVPVVHIGPAPDADKVPDFFRSLLNQPALADVEFVVKPEGGEARVIYAHRLILAAASEHFHQSFTSGLSEAVGVGGRCRIELPDWVEARPLLWMLAYLYEGYDPQKARVRAHELHVKLERAATGVRSTPMGFGVERRRSVLRCQDPEAGEDLCCLLRLAEFYDLEHLKRWAEHQLDSLKTPENLVALSTHAYFCNAHQLLQVCVFHIRLIYADLVGTQEWEQLEPAIKDLVLSAREG